jgi:hypothetical protein
MSSEQGEQSDGVLTLRGERPVARGLTPSNADARVERVAGMKGLMVAHHMISTRYSSTEKWMRRRLLHELRV